MIEKGERNYSAYVPDLPGFVSFGDTLDEVKSENSQAIVFHLDGIGADGEIPPLPLSRADYIEIDDQAA